MGLAESTRHYPGKYIDTYTGKIGSVHSTPAAVWFTADDDPTLHMIDDDDVIERAYIVETFAGIRSTVGESELQGEIDHALDALNLLDVEAAMVIRDVQNVPTGVRLSSEGDANHWWTIRAL